jgi:hypothetical protein
MWTLTGPVGQQGPALVPCLRARAWCEECDDYRAITSTDLVGALSDLINGQKQKPQATKRAIAAQRRELRNLERQVTEARRRLTE